MEYNNLRYGWQGEEVKDLQNALISAGYDVGSTGADGVFGNNTLAAVKQYQKDNGLTVDGIAGKNTQGLLYSTGTTKPTTTGGGASSGGNAEPKATAPVTNTTAGGYTYEVFAPSEETTAAGERREEILSQKPGEFTYDPYAKSDIVLQAESLLADWYAGKPGDYTPVWLDEANAYLSKYENRDPFSYDFNSDALYNQYKDQYIQQGRMAMMDTMGQAAAMTGGYGNSYAQTVGQQAYNQQLGQLNEIMPELYGMAYDRYNQEGQDLLNMYGIYMDRENQEYGKYQDNLNNWYRHLDYLQTDAATKSEEDYSRWKDKVGMDYDLHQDTYNDWLNTYNQADSTYWNLYDRDYNVYSDENAMNYEDYWNNKNQEFTASENDKSRAASEKANAKSDLINLITGTGYEPTDSELKAAGMSREQANSYLNAYKSSNSGSYITPSLADRDLMEKSVAKVTTVEQLESLTFQYLAMGYDPDFVEYLTSARAAEIVGENEAWKDLQAQRRMNANENRINYYDR